MSTTPIYVVLTQMSDTNLLYLHRGDTLIRAPQQRIPDEHTTLVQREMLRGLIRDYGTISGDRATVPVVVVADESLLRNGSSLKEDEKKSLNEIFDNLDYRDKGTAEQIKWGKIHVSGFILTD